MPHFAAVVVVVLFFPKTKAWKSQQKIKAAHRQTISVACNKTVTEIYVCT